MAITDNDKKAITDAIEKPKRTAIADDWRHGLTPRILDTPDPFYEALRNVKSEKRKCERIHYFSRIISRSRKI